MTAEQLQQAREAAWRQDGRAVLTADDAAAWIREITLLPFLPRPAQIAAPAPSFVEATLGRSELQPRPDAVEAASALLRRLLAAGDAVALRLLGASAPGAGSGSGMGAGSGLGTDGPDFLTTEETLPFVFALRGDREWTRGPRGRSSPLVLEVWKLLERDGALSAAEVKDRMGRHLTESAALRALAELWGELRIEPVFTAGEATRWQLLERAHEKAMSAGSAMAQGMALSALVSVYLQGAVAATGEEIEAFLTPLASRSRVREAVRGLHATRQLGLRNLGPREHFFVEGSLPAFAEQEAGETLSGEGRIRDKASRKETAGKAPSVGGELLETPSPAVVPGLLPEVPAPADVVFAADGESEGGGLFRIEALSEDETEHERTAGEGRKRYVAGRSAPSGDRKNYAARPPFGAARRGSSGARPDGFRSGPPRPRPGGQGPGEGAPRPGGERKPFFAREPWKEDRRPAAPSRAASFRPEGPAGQDTAGKSGAPGPGSVPARPFAPREGRPSDRAGKRPFSRREGGDQTPFVARANNRTAPGSDRKPFSPRREAAPGEGEQRPFGGNAPGLKPAGGKPFRRPFEGGPGGGFAPGGTRPPRRSFAPGFLTPGPGDSAGPRAGSHLDPGAGEGTGRPPAPRDEFVPRKPFSPRPGPGARAGGGNGPARNGFAGSPPDRVFTPRNGGFRPREDGERRPYTPRGTGEGAPRPGGEGPGRPSRGPDPNRGSDRGSDRPARGSQRGPAGAPFSPRAGGAAKPFRRSEKGPETPRRTGRPGSGRFSPESRPTGPSSGKAPSGGTGGSSKRPRTSPFTSSGKPRPGVGAAGRPGPRSARPGAGPRKAPSGPGKTGSKPGGKGGRKRP